MKDGRATDDELLEVADAAKRYGDPDCPKDGELGGTWVHANSEGAIEATPASWALIQAMAEELLRIRRARRGDSRRAEQVKRLRANVEWMLDKVDTLAKTWGEEEAVGPTLPPRAGGTPPRAD